MPRVKRARRFVAVAVFGLLWTAAGVFAAEGLWAKGNTHTHTNISDGDAPPAEVVTWYKDHGYQFVVLTDHHRLAPPAFFDQHTDGSFVVIPGVEMSATRQLGDYNVHINAIGISSPPQELVTSDIAQALIANMEVIRRAGGIVQLNHPSFHLRDRNAISKVSGVFLMEVCNDSSRGDPMGSLHQPLFEYAYEAALTAGKRAYAVAVDDAHNYHVFDAKQANPGRGWVMVHVPKLTREEILKNLAAGNFYASTGVEIAQYATNDKHIRVCIKPVPGVKYTIWFIGHGGMPLAKVTGEQAEYHLRGRPVEKYVRVRVDASDGTKAWLQPVWPGSN